MVWKFEVTWSIAENPKRFVPVPGAGWCGTAPGYIAVLRELEILVDGDHFHAYMLQIFLKESAGLYGDAAAGPFFYEIIQRKGDRGFGAGNFRALFESIEREQRERGAI